jgi:hypothetical protein
LGGHQASHFADVPPAATSHELSKRMQKPRGRLWTFYSLDASDFHLIESHKIRNRVLLDEACEVSRDWMKLEQAVSQTKKISRKKSNFTQLTFYFEEVLNIYDSLEQMAPDRFYLHVFTG